MRAFVKITTSLVAVAAIFGAVAGSAVAQEKFVLHGASQFDEKHAFTRLMRKFEQ